jgi:acetoin utilization protein AcuA
VRIASWCRPSFILPHSFSKGIGSFPGYTSLIRTPEGLGGYAEAEDGNVVLAVNEGDEIVGFAAGGYPGPEERWSRLPGRCMYELAAIEVSREWREAGLAKEMLGAFTKDGFVEGKIVYLVGYSWHWDWAYQGVSVEEYRRILINLVRPFGFIHYYTNDPDVCLKPENVFMARVGGRVTDEDRKRFRLLRFLPEGGGS